MDCRFLSMVLADVLAFGVAFAQSADGLQQQMPPPDATTEMQTAPHNHQPQSSGAARQTFDDLAGRKGYITEQDAQRDPWLRSHFAECDTNRDGKISREEYNQCRKDQSTIGQPLQQPGNSSRR